MPRGKWRLELWLALGLGVLAAAPAAAGIAKSVHWSRDGQRVVVVVQDSIHVFDGAGRALKSLKAGAPVATASLSPDGRALVLTTNDGKGWVLDTDGGGKTLIFQPAGPLQGLVDAAWSGDGTALTFTVVEINSTAAPMGSAEKSINVYWVKADGTGKKLLVTTAP